MSCGSGGGALQVRRHTKWSSAPIHPWHRVPAPVSRQFPTFGSWGWGWGYALTPAARRNGARGCINRPDFIPPQPSPPSPSKAFFHPPFLYSGTYSMRFGGLDGCMALQASPTDASYSLCCCRPATSERSAFVLVLETVRTVCPSPVRRPTELDRKERRPVVRCAPGKGGT